MCKPQNKMLLYNIQHIIKGEFSIEIGNTSRSASAIKLNWSKLSGAYTVKGLASATTKNLSVTKTKLTKGATYKFKVRAYKTVGSNVYYGAFSSAKAVKVK